jgi:hypothetical protein
MHFRAKTRKNTVALSEAEKVSQQKQTSGAEMIMVETSALVELSGDYA